MITLNTIYSLQQYEGLSTDGFPSSDVAVNGDRFFQIDTGKVFLYDETGEQWLEFTGGLRW